MESNTFFLFNLRFFFLPYNGILDPFDWKAEFIIQRFIQFDYFELQLVSLPLRAFL